MTVSLFVQCILLKIYQHCKISSYVELLFDLSVCLIFNHLGWICWFLKLLQFLGLTLGPVVLFLLATTKKPRCSGANLSLAGLLPIWIFRMKLTREDNTCKSSSSLSASCQFIWLHSVMSTASVTSRVLASGSLRLSSSARTLLQISFYKIDHRHLF